MKRNKQPKTIQSTYVLSNGSTLNCHNLFTYKEYTDQIQNKKRILHVPKGSMVLWDSRTFHQNQHGNLESNEERMIQYICFFPKN